METEFKPGSRDFVSHLTDQERSKLIVKLKNNGFKINNAGSIDVENPKEEHPHTGSRNSIYGSPVNYLPVGFIGKESNGWYYRHINLDQKFPEDYHKQIENLL